MMARKKKTPRDASQTPRSIPDDRAPRDMGRASQESPEFESLENPQWPAEDDTELPEEALDLVIAAYKTDDPEQRLQLATQALELWPECPDAYLCLAELAPSPGMAMDLYSMAADTALHVLGGEECLSEYRGLFWQDPNTRPLLHAKLGLAQTCWTTGDRDQAVQECRELLQLDAEDHIRAHGLLCYYYLQMERSGDLQLLLEQFRDDTTAELQFARALLAYRLDGDTETSRAILREAHQANPHVACQLLDTSPSPPSPEAGFTLGSASEAEAYVHDYRNCWRDTEGALPWVRETLRPEPPAPKRRAMSWSALKGPALGVPQDEDADWEVDIRRTQGDEPAGQRPWIVLVVNQLGTLLTLESYGPESKPTPRMALEVLVRAIRKPRFAEPARPMTVSVRQKTLYNAWRDRLRELEITCELQGATTWIDAAQDAMTQANRVLSVTGDELASRRSDLETLPQEQDEVWQADVLRMACWIEEQGTPRRPWLTLVTSPTSSMILSHDLSLDQPGGDALWQVLQKAMLMGPSEEPHRPGRIEVGSADQKEFLQPHLAALGIEIQVCQELAHLREVKSEMEAAFADDEQMAALIDMPLVTPGRLSDVYAAAADFYRARPWNRVSGDTPIRIVCDHFQTSTWYAIVMGQSGIAPGLALYEDQDVLRDLLREAPGADRRNNALSLMYGEAFEIAARDVDAAERHDWSVAGPQAYPLFLRINPGMTVRPMLAWELELTETVLRAIPAFVNEPDSGSTELLLSTSSSEVSVEMSWWEA